MMKRLLSIAGLVLTLSLNGGGNVAHAQAFTYYVGEVRLFGPDFCPHGWVRADGSLVNIQQNTGLFSLFGNVFGGDGTTTFALPNPGPPPPLMLWCVAVTGVWPQRP